MKKFFGHRSVWVVGSALLAAVLLVLVCAMWVPAPQAGAEPLGSESEAPRPDAIGELWQPTADGGFFIPQRLEQLYTALTGQGTLTALQALTAEKARDASYFRQHHHQEKVTLTLGGIVFTAVYLSADDNGDPVLTLYQTSPWLDENGDERRVSYTDGWYSTAVSAQYPQPANLYATSYLRTQYLNNGGTYNGATPGDDAHTSYTVKTATQSLSHPLALFTMAEAPGSLYEYLDTPDQMSWQRSQKATDLGASYDFGNDALQPAADSKWYRPAYGTGVDYGALQGADAWGNDKVWLPSKTEIGGVLLGARGEFLSPGLWNMTTEERGENDLRVWTRSAHHALPHMVRTNRITLANSGERIASSSLVTERCFVRFALHLNLAKAARNVGTGVPVPTFDVQSAVYDGTAHTFALQGFDGDAMQLQGGTPAFPQSEGTTFSATQVGEYGVKVQLKDKTNTFWLDDDFTQADKQISVHIQRAEIALKSLPDYTYDATDRLPDLLSNPDWLFEPTGNNQTPANIPSPNGGYSIILSYTQLPTGRYELLPSQQAKDAGYYSLRISLQGANRGNSNFCIVDESAEQEGGSAQLEMHIAEAEIEVGEIQPCSAEFDGQWHPIFDKREAWTVGGEPIDWYVDMYNETWGTQSFLYNEQEGVTEFQQMRYAYTWDMTVLLRAKNHADKVVRGLVCELRPKPVHVLWTDETPEVGLYDNHAHLPTATVDPNDLVTQVGNSAPDACALSLSVRAREVGGFTPELVGNAAVHAGGYTATAVSLNHNYVVLAEEQDYDFTVAKRTMTLRVCDATAPYGNVDAPNEDNLPTRSAGWEVVRSAADGYAFDFPDNNEDWRFIAYMSPATLAPTPEDPAIPYATPGTYYILAMFDRSQSGVYRDYDITWTGSHTLTEQDRQAIIDNYARYNPYYEDNARRCAAAVGVYTVTEADIVPVSSWQQVFSHPSGESTHEFVIEVGASDLLLKGDVAFAPSMVTYSNLRDGEGNPVDVGNYRMEEGKYVLWQDDTYQIDVTVTAPCHRTFQDALQVTISGNAGVITVCLDGEAPLQAVYGTYSGEPTDAEALGTALLDARHVLSISGLDAYDTLQQKLDALFAMGVQVSVDFAEAQRSTSGYLRPDRYTLDVALPAEAGMQITFYVVDGSTHRNTGADMLEISKRPISYQDIQWSQFENNEYVYTGTAFPFGDYPHVQNKPQPLAECEPDQVSFFSSTCALNGAGEWEKLYYTPSQVGTYHQRIEFTSAADHSGLSGADRNCYQIVRNGNEEVEGVLKIVKRQVAVQLFDARVTYGDPFVRPSVTLIDRNGDGNLPDAPADILTLHVDGTIDRLQVGVYPIVTDWLNANYEVVAFLDAAGEEVEGHYTVDKREVRVRIFSIPSLTYGTTRFDLDYTLTSDSLLAYDDTKVDLSVRLYPRRQANRSSWSVGTYPIEGVSTSRNYDVHFVGLWEGSEDFPTIEAETAGRLVIVARPINVRILGQSAVYNGQEPQVEQGQFELVNSALGFSDALADLQITLGKAAGTGAGEYALTGNCSNPNYAVTWVDEGVFTIQKQPVALPAIHPLVYDHGNPLTPQIDANPLYELVSGELPRREGHYTLTVRLTDGANYCWDAASLPPENLDEEDGTVLVPYHVDFATNRFLTPFEQPGWTYGSQPVLTPIPATEYDGDVFTPVMRRSLTYYSDAACTQPVLSFDARTPAGTYYAKVVVEGVLEDDVPDFTPIEQVVAFEVAPYQVQVRIADQSGVYGDALLPDPTRWTLLGSLVFEEDQLAITLVKSGANAAGQYALVGYNANPNYAVRFLGSWSDGQSGTYTVHKKAITVTVESIHIAFGEPEQALHATPDEGAVLMGDNLRISLSRDPGDHVGTYAIHATYANPNYAITFLPGTYTIVQATNSWVEEFSVTGWTRGDRVPDLVASARFGEPQITFYYDAACKKPYKGSIASAPTGTYYVKVQVAGTQDYSELTAFYSIHVTAKDPFAWLYYVVGALGVVTLALAITLLVLKLQKPKPRSRKA